MNRKKFFKTLTATFFGLVIPSRFYARPLSFGEFLQTYRTVSLSEFATERPAGHGGFLVPKYIAEEVIQRFFAAEHELYINGSGTGKPVGIIASFE